MTNVIKHEGPVYLEPIEHVYWHRETGEAYSSVTQALGRIEEHFDSEAVAMRIAMQSDTNPRKNPEYIGMTTEQILENWDQKTVKACDYGTMVHEIVERYLLANKLYIAKDDFEKKVINAYEALGIEEGVAMYPERIMFSEEYQLAGTADLVIDVDDKWFDIGDWKTNKEYNYFSKYGKTLLPPFEHLQDCQHSVYSIQLSTYAYMYEQEYAARGIEKKCRRIWIGFHDKETLGFELIPVTYLKDQAKKLLEHHRYNLKLENG